LSNLEQRDSWLNSGHRTLDANNPIDQNHIQKVEETLNSKWRGDKLQYLIKWKGQPLEERTWENRAKVIKGALRSCKEFHQKHPDAVMNIEWDYNYYQPWSDNE